MCDYIMTCPHAPSFGCCATYSDNTESSALLVVVFGLIRAWHDLAITEDNGDLGATRIARIREVPQPIIGVLDLQPLISVRIGVFVALVRDLALLRDGKVEADSVLANRLELCGVLLCDGEVE
jgi:hypothetical protein